MSVASKVRLMIAVYSRFRDICIYIYIYIYICVCVCVCLHVNCARPCTPYASPITSAYCALSFRTLAAVRSTTFAFSIGMADGTISAEDSPDDDSYLSPTRTTTGHKKRPEDDSDLGRTRTATGHKKRSCSLAAAQREEELAAERLHTSSYYTCTFPYTSSAYCQYIHTFHVSLLCYYSSFKFIHCFMLNVEVRGMCLRIAYA